MLHAMKHVLLFCSFVVLWLTAHANYVGTSPEHLSVHRRYKGVDTLAPSCTPPAAPQIVALDPVSYCTKQARTIRLRILEQMSFTPQLTSGTTVVPAASSSDGPLAGHVRGQRNQYRLTRSELFALGLRTGMQVGALRLKIVNLPAPTMDYGQFTIRVWQGNMWMLDPSAPSTSLLSYDFTDVYTAQSFPKPSATGNLDIVLDQPFVYNNSDYLVIEICRYGGRVNNGTIGIECSSVTQHIPVKATSNSVTGSDACSAATGSSSNFRPTFSFGILNNTSTIIQGASLTYAGQPTYYNLNLPANYEGTLNITANTVISGCTSAASSPLQVQVYETPAKPTITVIGSTNLCQGAVTTLQAPAGNAYLWSNGATTRSIDVTSAGTFTVRLINQSCTSAASDPVVISATATGAAPHKAQLSLVQALPECGTGTRYLIVSTATDYATSQLPRASINAVTPASNGSTGPFPANFGGAKTQYLYTANELRNAGVAKAKIRGLRFTNTAERNGGNPITLNGFNIKLRQSATLSFGASNFLGSMTTVRNEAPIQLPTTVGEHTILFDTPFEYTGTQPLALEFCWTNGNAGIPNATLAVQMDQGGLNNSNIRVVNNNNAVCSGSTTGTMGNLRPVIKFLLDYDDVEFISQGIQASTVTSEPTLNWHQYTINPGDADTLRIRARFMGFGICAGPFSEELVIVNKTMPDTTVTASRSLSFCTGDSVVLTAAAGYTYLWSTGETTRSITVKSAGDVSVTVTGPNGCSATSGIRRVSSLTPPRPGITGASLSCNNTLVTLSAPAGYGYLWNTGATSRTIITNSSGSYTVRVIANGCTSEASEPHVLTVVPPIPKPAISGNHIICAGAGAYLSGPEGYKYIWSNGDTTRSITLYMVQTVSLRVILNGCTSEVSNPVTIVINTIPKPSISGNPIICAGQGTVLTGPSGYRYLWSTGETTRSIVVTSPATITLMVMFVACTSQVSDAVVTTVVAKPRISSPGQRQICSGSATLISTSDGQPAMWNTGAFASQISASTTGYYYTIAAAGCHSDSVLLTVQSIPQPTIGVIGNSNICTGEPVKLFAVPHNNSNLPPLTPLWSTGESTDTIIIPATRTISLRYVSAQGCTSASSAPVEVTVRMPLQRPVLSVEPNQILCVGSMISAIDTCTDCSYTWLDGATGRTRPATLGMEYAHVSATRSSFCYSSSEWIPVSVVSNGLWMGQDTLWNKPENWCGGVPGPSTTIRISNEETILPAVQGRAEFHSFVYNGQRPLRLSPNSSLTIYGNYSGGPILAPQAQLRFEGTGYGPLKNILARHLVMNKPQGQLYLLGPVTVTDTLSMLDGYLQASYGHPLILGPNVKVQETANSYITGRVEQHAIPVGQNRVARLGLIIGAGQDDLDTVFISRNTEAFQFSQGTGYLNVYAIRGPRQPVAGRAIGIERPDFYGELPVTTRWQLWWRQNEHDSWKKKGFPNTVRRCDSTGCYSQVWAQTTHFSDWTMSPEDYPLPIRWASIHAMEQDNRQVVRWATAMELNNLGFAIFHSRDGFMWDSVGWLPSLGNSTSLQQYQFTVPITGKSYYKIKQRDLDGTTSWSPVAVVEGLRFSKVTWKLFPNPSDGVVSLEADEQVAMQLYAPDGKLVLQQILEPFQPTKLPPLATGLYHYKLTGSASQQHGKLQVR